MGSALLSELHYILITSNTKKASEVLRKFVVEFMSRSHTMRCLVPPCDYICVCFLIAFRINISDLDIYLFTLLTLPENLSQAA